MRIGNLRTKHKVIEGKDKWIVQGRKQGAGWESCYDPEREKKGLDKWLISIWNMMLVVWSLLLLNGFKNTID